MGLTIQYMEVMYFIMMVRLGLWLLVVFKAYLFIQTTDSMGQMKWQIDSKVASTIDMVIN